jgi:FixJ family two-component response regulator
VGLEDDNLPVRLEGRLAGRNEPYLVWVKDELEKLSVEDQEILLWRAQDIAYAWIAHSQGISESTARVRHLRAMNKLTTAASLAGMLDSPTGQDIQEPGAGHE